MDLGCYSPCGSKALTIKDCPVWICGFSAQWSSIRSQWIVPPSVANFGSIKTLFRSVVVSSSLGFSTTMHPPEESSRISVTVVSKLGISLILVDRQNGRMVQLRSFSEVNADVSWGGTKSIIRTIERCYFYRPQFAWQSLPAVRQQSVHGRLKVLR
jgi:hypothetical protein